MLDAWVKNADVVSLIQTQQLGCVLLTLKEQLEVEAEPFCSWECVEFFYVAMAF